MILFAELQVQDNNAEARDRSCRMIVLDLSLLTQSSSLILQ